MARCRERSIYFFHLFLGGAEVWRDKDSDLPHLCHLPFWGEEESMSCHPRKASWLECAENLSNHELHAGMDKITPALYMGVSSFSSTPLSHSYINANPKLLYAYKSSSVCLRFCNVTLRKCDQIFKIQGNVQICLSNYPSFILVLLLFILEVLGVMEFYNHDPLYLVGRSITNNLFLSS